MITPPEEALPAWDVFICHASEDKNEVAQPLANALAALSLHVWIDESEIRLGDSLRSKIDAGLAHSRFGVVILSENFFSKDWPKIELNGLIAREINHTKVILPIWHNITADDIRRHSPLLADRVAISTGHGLPTVARAIKDAIAASGPHYSSGTPLFGGRLTKRRLLSLPNGSFLMSNIVNPDHTPRVAEEVPDYKDREAFWDKLRASGVSMNKFYVFANVGEYRRYISARGIFLPW
jgi:hypothetical protein